MIWIISISLTADLVFPEIFEEAARIFFHYNLSLVSTGFYRQYMCYDFRMNNQPE